MPEEKTSYEYFYPGTPYTLEPEYGEIFTGYRIPAAELGASTSIQTANQIQQVTNLLNQGMKQIEVGSVSPEVFDMIPKQHLKEINRLAKLTGSETSVHAPIIDPSGFTQQGWNEAYREEAEKQFESIIERSHEINPEGNIPVTIHASAAPGAESVEIKDPKTGEIIEVPRRMIAVNRETGEFVPLIREERFYPEKLHKVGEKWKGKTYEVKEELDIANRSYWDQRLSQLIFYKEKGDELIANNEPLIRDLLEDIEKGKIQPQQLTKLSPEAKAAWDSIQNARLYLDNTYQTINSLFNQAYKFADERGKRELEKASEQFKKELKTYEQNPYNPKYLSNALQNLMNRMYDITINPRLTPQLYKPVEEFAKEKAGETLGNVAFTAYKKFKERAPIVSIENPPYGQALARAEDLKELIENSRKKFVEKAVKEGMSKSEAESAAKKLIGATWDTSHIAMMRKSGFKPEKLVEETRKIAPYVKHVHLNDNFGSSHTDLPPGMGSIPMKKVLEELKKAGFKGKKIFEGGNFFQHFQTSPHPYVLEAMGSPLYAAMMQPYWNQIYATYGNYFAFPSAYFPEQHFSLYGGGFSNLPAELGGQIPGKTSRATGTPMA